MNTKPDSIYAPSGLAGTVGAARLTETTRTTRAKDISGILAPTSRGLSMTARIFDGIAEQRARQAKQIVAHFGQDLRPDSLERQHAGKEPESKLGAWHWL